MSNDDEIELHKKFIKGVNLRLIVSVGSVLVSIVFMGTRVLDSFNQQAESLAKINVELQEIKVKEDTLSFRQELYRYQSKFELKDLQNEINHLNKRKNSD